MMDVDRRLEPIVLNGRLDGPLSSLARTTVRCRRAARVSTPAIASSRDLDARSAHIRHTRALFHDIMRTDLLSFIAGFEAFARPSDIFARRWRKH